MKTSQRAARLRLPALLSVGLALGLAGCSDSGVVDGVLVTSDSGLITINVPPSWQEATSVVQNQITTPGAHVELAWILEDTPDSGISSFIIVSYDGLSMSSTEFADASFAPVWNSLPDGEVAVRDTLTTASGIRFERQDVAGSFQGVSAYHVEIAAMVDGLGIEISITLFDDADRFLEEALDAVATLTVG